MQVHEDYEDEYVQRAFGPLVRLLQGLADMLEDFAYGPNFDGDYAIITKYLVGIFLYVGTGSCTCFPPNARLMPQAVHGHKQMPCDLCDKKNLVYQMVHRNGSGVCSTLFLPYTSAILEIALRVFQPSDESPDCPKLIQFAKLRQVEPFLRKLSECMVLSEVCPSSEHFLNTRANVYVITFRRHAMANHHQLGKHFWLMTLYLMLKTKSLLAIYMTAQEEGELL